MADKELTVIVKYVPDYSAMNGRGGTTAARTGTIAGGALTTGLAAGAGAGIGAGIAGRSAGTSVPSQPTYRSRGGHIPYSLSGGLQPMGFATTRPIGNYGPMHATEAWRQRERAKGLQSDTDAGQPVRDSGIGFYDKSKSESSYAKYGARVLRNLPTSLTLSADALEAIKIKTPRLGRMERDVPGLRGLGSKSGQAGLIGFPSAGIIGPDMKKFAKQPLGKFGAMIDKATDSMAGFAKKSPVAGEALGKLAKFAPILGVAAGALAVVAIAAKKGVNEYSRLLPVAAGYNQQAAGHMEMMNRAGAAGFAGPAKGDIMREFARSALFSEIGREARGLMNTIMKPLTYVATAGMKEEDIKGGMLAQQSMNLQQMGYFRNLSRNNEDFQSITGSRRSISSMALPAGIIEGSVSTSQTTQNADAGYYLAQLQETWLKTAGDASKQAEEMKLALNRIASAIANGR